MKKIVSLLLVTFGASILSGCKTEEVRPEPAINDKLTFYSETKDEKSTAEKQTEQATSQKITNPPVTNNKMYSSQPPIIIDKNKKYTATIKTSVGDIEVELNAKETPVTVNNFVFLSRNDFYDGTIFHRTIKNFMIQGGDPEGTGRGGPGYQFDDEPFEGEYTRGTVAMANAGPDTNGSQFFIMHADVSLPPNYVIFGKVSDGMNVVDKIATAPTKPEGEGSTPVHPVTVNLVEIKEK